MSVIPTTIPKIDQIKFKTFKRTFNTLDDLKTLFNNSGLVFSILYLVLEYLIRPKLEEQYEQRTSLSGMTLLRLRKMVSNLKKRLDTHTLLSTMGFNETEETVDRYTQTSEDFHYKNELTSGSTIDEINSNLEDLAVNLNMDNINAEMSSGVPETILQDIKSCHNDINNTMRANPAPSSKESILQSIREIKGWYVNGRIP